MNRLGLLAPSELSPAQRSAYATLEEYTTTQYGDKSVRIQRRAPQSPQFADLKHRFTYMDKQQRLVGPFGIHVHHPELGEAFIQFARALKSIPGLKPEVRECAILGVGSRLQAGYEEYAHQYLSGFSKAEQDLLHHGQCPQSFSTEQKTAYLVALELGKPGPLSEDIWADAVQVLGIQGATALVHYVGFYCYVSTILNGFDAKIPSS